ncbi:DivIVA domain-containing protein [Microbispora sp. CA-102843]|uniref:DivIVA domain-containing protein n=1 Tax=Microbispora sp. CA-102843 TaxID=3239952 RepID=UPI003D8C4333
MNRFPRVIAVRLGYDPEQVDDFVRRIERTLGLGPLDGPPVTADEIRNAKFAVKLGGYNETAVDFALDAFIVAVEARAGKDTTPAPSTPAVPPPPAAQNAAPKPTASEPATPKPAAPKPAAPKPAASERAGTEPEPAVEQPAASEPAAPKPAASEHAAKEPEPASSGSAAARAVAASPRRTRAEERARSDEAPAKATRGEKTGTLPPEPGTPSWRETQAARVEHVAFRPGRLGMGYREEEVDAFLDRVVATLRETAAEPLTAEQVRRATFATVVFRPGYAIREVDGFLAEMASVLERRP